jgi:hypothetical protein
VITSLRAELYERASSQSGMYIRWYGDNIWLFVPAQQKLKAFLTTLPDYPFQRGSSLNAGRSPAEKFTESCSWKCNSHSRDYTPT